MRIFNCSTCNTSSEIDVDAVIIRKDTAIEQPVFAPKNQSTMCADYAQYLVDTFYYEQDHWNREIVCPVCGVEHRFWGEEFMVKE